MGERRKEMEDRRLETGDGIQETKYRRQEMRDRRQETGKGRSFSYIKSGKFSTLI